MSARLHIPSPDSGHASAAQERRSDPILLDANNEGLTPYSLSYLRKGGSDMNHAASSQD